MDEKEKSKWLIVILIFIGKKIFHSQNQDAKKIIADARNQSDEYIDKVKKENEEKITAMIEESNLRIKEQEKKSRGEIEKATLETIKSISAKFIDKMPSDNDIVKKLN